jgi:hypothetical protein
MSLLRILRNLAGLLILAMAVLASTSRPAAAKKQVCLQLFEPCGFTIPCCRGLVCGSVGDRSICQLAK